MADDSLVGIMQQARTSLLLAAQSDDTRVVVSFFSGVATGLLVILLTASFFWSWNFILKVIVWFFLCVAICHWIFASSRSLDVTTVRKIDYLYLGVAAAGILVLSSQYTEQRAQLAAQLEVRSAELDESRELRRLRVTLGVYVSSACGRMGTPRSVEHCELARQIDELLDTRYTTAQLDNVITRLVRLKLSPIVPSIPLAPFELNSPSLHEEAGARLLWSLQDIVRIRQGVSTDKGPAKEATPSQVQRVTQVGQLILWPFILALAFALRITKVTVEVLEWGVNRSPSSATEAGAAPPTA